MWSVQDAKANFSTLMRRARAGEPQEIVAEDGGSGILMLKKDYLRLKASAEKAIAEKRDAAGQR